MALSARDAAADIVGPFNVDITFIHTRQAPLISISISLFTLSTGKTALQLLEEATSAAAGAAVATTTLYPLELTKTRLVSQTGARHKGETTLSVLRQIVADNGVVGLYQGLGAKCAHSMLQSFLYFYLYTFAKKVMVARQRWAAGRAARGAAAAAGASVAQAAADAAQAAAAVPATLGTAANLVAGYAAAVMGTAVTLPLEVFTARYQVAGKDTSAWKVFDAIRGGGWHTFYTGFKASLFLCINPAINYTTFEQLKSRWLRYTGAKRLSVSQAFLLGVVAKITATLATCVRVVCVCVWFVLGVLTPRPCGCCFRCHSYPQIRAKIIQQTHVTPSGNASSAASKGADAADAADAEEQATAAGSVSDILRHIMATEGVTGLYKGLQPQLLRTVLASALMMTVRERVARRTSAMLWLFIVGCARLVGGAAPPRQ